MKSKIIAVTTIVFLILLINCVPAGSVDTEKLEKEKLDLEKQKQRVEQLLNKKNLEKKGIANQFYKLDKELSNTEYKLSKTQKELKKTESHELYLEKQLDISSEKFFAYRKQYMDRLVAFYKNGHAGYLEVLLNATSFSDFVSRITYIRLLTKNDLEIMKNLKEMREDIKTKRNEVETARVKIIESRDMIAHQKQQVAVMHREKKKALDEIIQDVNLLQKQYDELEKENSRIENEIRKTKGLGPSEKFTGKFSSPVCGRRFYITSPYGPRKAPKRGASSNHRGIDLRARYNEDICAAADGVVIQAKMRSGYGRTVIIKHGPLFSTVYAHGKKILVREGQKVTKGQVIMKADSSGISTGSHLHFEIRENGVAQNPMNYLGHLK
ncbi:MAG TPA: peptidoglycan DD-metalloendopeptidase family protein [bacterium]|nr:peptidoglycan DD-metalloendopeptidase family protein [bacterium]